MSLVELLERPGPVAPGELYTVSVTRLRVRRPWHLPRFARATGGVLAQMREAPGLVAGGVRVRARRLEFSTYGAFASRADLGRFTAGGVHGEVFRALRGRLGPLEAAKAELSGAALPGSWADIDRLLDRSSTGGRCPTP